MNGEELLRNGVRISPGLENVGQEGGGLTAAVGVESKDINGSAQKVIGEGPCDEVLDFGEAI